MTRLKDAYFAREAPHEDEAARLRLLDAFYAAPTVTQMTPPTVQTRRPRSDRKRP